MHPQPSRGSVVRQHSFDKLRVTAEKRGRCARSLFRVLITGKTTRCTAVGGQAGLGEFMAFQCDFVGLRFKMALFASGCSKLRPGWPQPASGSAHPWRGQARLRSGWTHPQRGSGRPQRESVHPHEGGAHPSSRGACLRRSSVHPNRWLFDSCRRRSGRLRY